VSTDIASELTVEPILQYPRLAAVGTSFLLTVDLKPQQFGDTWAYPDLEEIPIRCIINPGKLFRVEFFGEPVTIVHRYGGTYGAARFLLTPEPNSLNKSGKIQITLANRFGVPMTVLETEAIAVQESVSAESLIALALGKRKPIEWLEDPFESIVAVTMTKTFAYEVGKLEVVKSRNFLNREKKFQVNKQIQEGQRFIELLPNDTNLRMIVIPAGSFLMGAPETEAESSNNERPQHEVHLPAFCMGKYPITQAQWRSVASMPKIKQDMKEDPSRFKGSNRPVEKVSWFEAVEFCDRLSVHTGKKYRLPSEVEWEYACRAGTTTPFHYGETITPEIVNYNGDYPYGEAPKGEYRKKTTPVGKFLANAFGLYHMHGNVLEWCEDDWHDNYEGAPTDGRAWIDNDNRSQEENVRKLLRGGSWCSFAWVCRSAFRYLSDARFQDDDFGFRVVCVFQ